MMHTLVLLILILNTPTILYTAAQEEEKVTSQFGVLAEYNNRAAIASLSWSPDQNHIAIGSFSLPTTYTVNICDVTSHSQIDTIEGPKENIKVKYSPDGYFLAVSGGPQIIIFDSSTMKAKTTMNVSPVFDGTDVSINSIDWSKDGKTIAAGTTDSHFVNKILIVDPQTNNCIKQLKGHTNKIRCVCCSPSEQHQLASASQDKTVRLWDSRSDKSTHVLEGHNNSVRSVCYSPNSAQLVSGSERNIVFKANSTVCTWNAQAGELLTEFDHEKSVAAVCYLLGTQYIVSGSSSRFPSTKTTVKVWNQDSSECQQILEGFNGIITLCPSPDGSQFASGSLDGKLRIYSAGIASSVDGSKPNSNYGGPSTPLLEQ